MQRTKWAAVILILIGPQAVARRSYADAKPEVKSSLPMAVPAGHTTVITVFGDNLAPKQLLCTKSGIKVVLKETGPTDEKTKSKGNSRVTLELTAAPGVPPESAEVTFVQADGVKAPVQIAIVEDTTDVIAVKKPASTFATAMLIVSRSVAVTGTLDGDQADVFRIDMLAGEAWDVTLLCGRGGSMLDPVLRIRDSRHVCLALSAGDKKKDRRILFKAPAAGAYYIEITDAEAKGGGGYDYRLTMHPHRQ